MSHIYVPSCGPEDWRGLLADPETQWRQGYSARTTAYCWEAAGGFPAEIESALTHSGFARFRQVEPLLIVPEYKTDLPGGGRPSQTDVFALAKDAQGDLLALTVEAKVAESFGPTLEEWAPASSPGKTARLEAIRGLLGLPQSLPDAIRYQLLHRTASAVIEARRFNARSAMMIVHAFGHGGDNHADYRRFVELFGTPAPEGLALLRTVDAIDIYAAWVEGDPVFLKA